MLRLFAEQRLGGLQRASGWHDDVRVRLAYRQTSGGGRTDWHQLLADMAVPLPGRADPIPGTAGKRVVFFDGVCNMCNGYVDFLIKRDHARVLMFASLQSDAGRVVTRAVPAAVARDTYYSIFLLDTDGQIYERSDAILKTLVSLGGMYRLFAIFWLVPRLLRDVVYRGVSRWRYRIFGKRESCRLPTPEERAMFVPE